MDIFPDNIPKPVIKTELPSPGKRIESTKQLVYCTSLLIRGSLSPAPVLEEDVAGDAALLLQETTLDKAELDWLEEMNKNPKEKEDLRSLQSQMVSAYFVNPVKVSAEIAEIVALGPILEKESFRVLLDSFLTEFGQSVLLNISLLLGLVDLVQSATSGFLYPDDMIKILDMLRVRLQDTHQQSSETCFYLTFAVSRILDVMGDNRIRDLDRTSDYGPLSRVLSTLRGSSDPHLIYQACYASQALRYVPDNMTALEDIVDGLVMISSATFKLDLASVLKGLGRLQASFGGIAKAAATDSAHSLMESGRLNSRRRPWYPAIKAAYAFAQAGQLKDLKQLIFEAPCRHDPLFQWGICQLLDEMALSPVWAVATRQQAITLLGHLFKVDRNWGHDDIVKAWMLTIVTRLGTESDQAVITVARALMQNLKQDQYSPFQENYPLTIHLPIPESSLILARVYNTSSIEYVLNDFRNRRLNDADLPVYIPPMAKANLQARDDHLFPLRETVQEFLESDRQVMLILGDSGSGKTTFNNHLEQDLLRSYKIGSCVPLFINIPTIVRPQEELLAKQLKAYGFIEAQIQELRQHHQLVAICDGYDESQLNINLHTDNLINHPGQWNAKLIIACRTQYLGPEYRNQFVPNSPDINDRPADDLFQEAAIIPFSESQIKDFIDQYVSHQSRPWTAEHYMEKLTAIPNLMDMAKNPFLLTIALDTLPRLVTGDSDLSKVRLFRAQLYDLFVENWLESNRRRLAFSALSVKDREVLMQLEQGGFTRVGVEYSKRIALAIFQEQDGNPVVNVQFIDSADRYTWRAELFGSQPDMRLLREASPLARTGHHFRFIHRSILEYFFSRTIFDPLNVILPDDETLSVADNPLSQRNLTSEPSVIQFLCDRVQHFPVFRQQLFAIIEKSKTDPEPEAGHGHAAANAITILCRAGVRFNGTDFSGTRISGADLSGAELDSVNFHGADLTGVKFSRSWIRQVDFTEAIMSGVQFGERSVSCSFSSDGQILSMGMSDGAVKLWNASTFHLSKVPHSQSALVSDIVFSSNYQQIASASEEFTIQMWDAEAGQRLQDLKGHTKRITCLAFSLDGLQLVTCSLDQTIRLWDLKTGSFEKIFLEHTGYINNINFSSDGRCVAVASSDTTGLLWDVQDHRICTVLRGHSAGVTTIVFSLDGTLLATGSADKTIRTWHSFNGELQHIITGHERPITALVYSSDGVWIASGGSDGLVRLWRSEDGMHGRVFPGHTLDITTLVFSPSKDLLISSSFDTTVRWWNIKSGESGLILGGSAIETAGAMAAGADFGDQDSKNTVVQLWEGDAEGTGTGSGGHSSKVTSVAFSFSGKQVFSGGYDRTMRSWDSQSAAPGQHFKGHERSVTAVAYSRRDDLVSASLDHTIRLWSKDGGPPLAVLRGHEAAVTSVAFTPCSQRVVSGSADWTVRVWDIPSGANSGKFVGHTQAVRSVAVSPAGSCVASGSEDKTVRIWELRSPGSSRELKGHTDSVSCVAYSTSGTHIASASEDGTARVWEAASGRFCFVMEGHTEGLLCVAFSPKYPWIATGGFDNTLRLWRWSAESGEILVVIKDFLGAVRTVAWSPDGMSFATGSDDRSVRVWRVVVAENNDIRVQLQWSSGCDVVVATDAQIQGAHFLSRVNITFLQQRGAIGGDSKYVEAKEE